MWRSILLVLITVGSSYQKCFSVNLNSPGSPSKSEILSCITDFGVDVYKQLAAKYDDQNLVYSPYSLWNALILTYLGTLGTTQSQMESALRVSNKASAQELKTGLNNWYKLLQQSHPGYYFGVANRIYFANSLGVRSCVLDLFSYEMQSVYLFHPESTSRYINDFVQKATRGLIKKLTTKENVENSQMILVNAAAFKGTWKYKFSPENNTRQHFQVNPFHSISMIMMRQQGAFNYGESKELGAHILELPYKGDQISMYFFLPLPERHADYRFKNLVENLNSRTLSDALNPDNLILRVVDVVLPKFNFSVEVGNHLKEALKAIGITDLFREDANMSAFTPKRGIKAKTALHKAFVEVNEEGTEAASATAVVISNRSDEFLESVIPFHLVEPFIFVIYDTDTKNPLFMGHVKNPFSIEKLEL